MESKKIDHNLQRIDAHVKGVLKHIKRIPTLSSQPEKKATLVKRVWEIIHRLLTAWDIDCKYLRDCRQTLITQT